MSKHGATIRFFLRASTCVAAIVAVAYFATDAWACPNCREALADDPKAQGLATGFYYSILFMMSMPFVVLGTLGTVFYRSVKRAGAEQQAAAVDAPADNSP